MKGHKKSIQEILRMLNELSAQNEKKGKDELIALTYLDTKEACVYLKMCRKTLYKHRMEGNIRYSKPGRKVLFKLTDLNAFIESRRL